MWRRILLLVVTMAFAVEVGHFVKETTGVANATQTVSLVDASLTPKAIIQCVVGQISTAHKALTYGFASGTAATNQRSFGTWAQDGVSTTDVGSVLDDNVFTMMTSSSAVGVQARINAFNAGSFQMIYIVNNTTALNVWYVVLGGDDLINAVCLGFVAPTAAGNRNDTGFGFDNPDCVLFVWSGGLTLGTIVANGRIGLGAAKSSTKLWAIANTGQDAQTMSASFGSVSSQRTDSCWLQLTVAAAPTVDGRSGYVGGITDGYTLDWADAPASAFLYGALALKGGQYAVDAFAKSTGGAPATQDVTIVGFDPRGFLLASRNNSVLDVVDDRARVSIGASDGTRERGVWTDCADVITTTADRRFINTNVLELARSDAGGSVLESLADHTADLVDGFRLVWDPNEAVAKQICYVAFGDTPVTPAFFEFRVPAFA